MAALIAALKKGGEPAGEYLTFSEGLKKQFGNWFRMFNRDPRKPV